MPPSKSSSRKKNKGKERKAKKERHNQAKAEYHSGRGCLSDAQVDYLSRGGLSGYGHGGPIGFSPLTPDEVEITKMKELKQAREKLSRSLEERDRAKKEVVKPLSLQDRKKLCDAVVILPEDAKSVAIKMIDHGIGIDSNMVSNQAKRVSEWGTGIDPIRFAAIGWPVFPKLYLRSILTTLIDKVIKIDKEEANGLFSSPTLPTLGTIPNYKSHILNPMDYTTMKKKLERGDYISAQSMQKDFILINDNCLKSVVSVSDSYIVREAQRQTLMRPLLLMDAAKEKSFFICEE